ncbi:twin-arginine translocation protein, TatA/E family subunit [Thermodesulfatator indicus DSM 15286]|uniref:Sec-independent protein translocase protein TatA n=1 Tax=Thermodesulfatator indicus (strain DSM 15286 / JCM 11887 / CIR29812) TaxID=667014 RepID=F8AAZ6_THEID|nr:twin-arginine translocase TatA/TatE family subunit [Thermodesulfatator indicus]AEH44362.1 twin-arginine translocation protein, TatA/E family subunit [Thermodesulfatator indicus DSM 15286]
MFGLGSQELLIILLIALVLFGAKRLPEIGAGLGKGIRAFKEGLREGENIEAEAKEEIEKKKA